MVLDASNDVLDARDKLLIDLSKLLNFTVDYMIQAKLVRLGDSGNGALVNRSKGSTTSASDDNNVTLVVMKGGKKQVFFLWDYIWNFKFL